MPTAPRRKGAVRRADIPPDVLRALNEGREETTTLVEWLAIDMRTLLQSVIPQAGLEEFQQRLEEAGDHLSDKGVTQRLKGIGAALFQITRNHTTSGDTFEALAGHTSDMVRVWAAT